MAGQEIFSGLDYAVVSGSAIAVKASPGRLAKIVVTTAGTTGAFQVNDNPSAASGPVLFAAPAAAAQGTIFDLDLRAKFGIFVTPASGQTVVVAFT